MYPSSIRNLIECLKDLPGIGEKTAERLAFSLINFNKDKLTSFSDAIREIRDTITTCEICGNITDDNVCSICRDKGRPCPFATRGGYCQLTACLETLIKRKEE